MAKITTLLFVFFSLLASAQQEASIQHYQRTWSTDTIHLPCEEWDTKDLLINVPDSLYDSGFITVKKMKYKGVSDFGYSLEIREGRVHKVTITAKGRKSSAILSQLAKEIAARDDQSICRFDVKSVNSSGRVKLTLNSNL